MSAGADQPWPAADERRADHSQRDNREEIDRESMRLVEARERGDPGRQQVWLRGRSHRGGHGRKSARLVVDSTLPEAPARPGLQERHAEQEDPESADQQSAQGR